MADEHTNHHSEIVKFEQGHHSAVWVFIVQQLENKLKLTRSKVRELKNIDVLDMSEDAGLATHPFLSLVLVPHRHLFVAIRRKVQMPSGGECYSAVAHGAHIK
jgi:hypothetical protein